MGSRGCPGLKWEWSAAPIALDRAADDPRPADENRLLLTSILSDGPSYWNTSSRIWEM
jgi:hypothetical protein